MSTKYSFKFVIRVSCFAIIKINHSELKLTLFWHHTFSNPLPLSLKKSYFSPPPLLTVCRNMWMVPYVFLLCTTGMFVCLSVNYLLVIDFVLSFTQNHSLCKVKVFWDFCTIHSNIIPRITRILKYMWFPSYHRVWLELGVCICGLLVSHNT